MDAAPRGFKDAPRHAAACLLPLRRAPQRIAGARHGWRAVPPALTGTRCGCFLPDL